MFYRNTRYLDFGHDDDAGTRSQKLNTNSYITHCNKYTVTIILCYLVTMNDNKLLESFIRIIYKEIKMILSHISSHLFKQLSYMNKLDLWFCCKTCTIDILLTLSLIFFVIDEILFLNKLFVLQ